MPSLICPDGAGSLNNPDAPPAQTGLNNPSLVPYTPTSSCMGSWQMSGLTLDECATNDQKRQENYIAETLNIAGAPINIFKLLGIHEQGNGSLLSEGRVIASQAYPGYPISGINGATPWRSLESGLGTANVSYVGVDFGIKLIPSVGTEYEPKKPKWTQIASINITQGSTPNEFARQVKVEITDGKCEIGFPFFTGAGNGGIGGLTTGSNATQATVTLVALTATTFNVYATLQDGSVLGLNNATVGLPFHSTFVNFTMNAGTVPFAAGDMFSIPVNYIWTRQGIYNLVQSPLPQTLNLQTKLFVKAFRITPTLFTGSGNWEVVALDVLDSAPTDINNIQDLFFNENRDRDYALVPIMLKAQYTPTDSVTDLNRFGLSMVDQYNFSLSFATMVQALGRPLVTGDIVEVIPEMQYDHNLKPVRKFLEITDTGWAAEGFSTAWRPTIYRFTAQQALPSQETRDIFGTLDSQKYLVANSILSDGVAEQIDTTPLTISEEIAKEAADRVPETGSNDGRELQQTPVKPPQPHFTKGYTGPAVKTEKKSVYIEDAMPPNGEPYGEGFAFPQVPMPADGDYFRLNYPPETKIAARLFRYSLVKNKWIFLESDKRGDYSSHKPSVRSILQSATKQGLGKKV